MARTDTLTNFLTDVASAIKEKKGDNTSILASDFDTEIIDLPSGGDDWSDIGYNQTPQVITEFHNYSKNIYDNWDSTASLTERFYNDRVIKIMPLVNISGGQAVSMFRGCSNLEEIPLLNFSGITSCRQMFMNCGRLKNIPQLDLSNVTDCYQMFHSCSVLESLPILNTNSCTNMKDMFMSCVKLKTITSINTNSCSDMQSMFSNCSSLENLPVLNLSSISGRDTLINMFVDCNNLTDTSLDNILQSCLSVTSSYKSTKSLFILGFRSGKYPASRIQALPHYQDFIDAGWTIGY